MLFPQADRYVYRKNPLKQVICQMRFPTILGINKESPATFQGKIRKRYPFYQEKIGTNLPPEILSQAPSVFAEMISDVQAIKAYEFISADRQWTISLTRDFLALTALKYQRWEDFKDHLVDPLNAFVEVYSPTFFSRVGLRYQNLIRRSELELEQLDWAKLLNQHIAAELAAPNISGSIVEAAHQIVIDLEEHEGRVHLQHGLIKDETSNGEICYLIDSDFFTEQQMETSNAEGIIDYFNKYNRLLFQWCITPALHEAMGPSPI